MTRTIIGRLQGLIVSGLFVSSAALAQDEGTSFRLYVSNEYAGTLSVIDGVSKEVIDTVPVGKRPRGLKVSPDGTKVYVALSGSPPAPPGVDESTLPPADKTADGIGVLDTETHELLDTIRGVSDPEQLAISKDGQYLYIASEDTGTAVVTEAESGRIIAIQPVGGEPEGVTISPDGSVVYMSSEEDDVIAVIETASNRVIAEIPVGRRPRFSAFSPDGTRAYVSGENDATITVVDTSDHSVIRTVQMEGEGLRPMEMALSPDGSRLYIATGRGATVQALDTETWEKLGEAEVGERPWGLAISPDGSEIFTADGTSHTVSVVDAMSMQLKQQIEVGERPWGVIVVE